MQQFMKTTGKAKVVFPPATRPATTPAPAVGQNADDEDGDPGLPLSFTFFGDDGTRCELCGCGNYLEDEDQSGICAQPTCGHHLFRQDQTRPNSLEQDLFFGKVNFSSLLHNLGTTGHPLAVVLQAAARPGESGCGWSRGASGPPWQGGDGSGGSSLLLPSRSPPRTSTRRLNSCKWTIMAAR